MELGILEKDSFIRIYADNLREISQANEDQVTARTKHIDIAHHLSREYIEKEDIVITYIKSDEMIADTLTKPKTKSKHLSARNNMRFYY